MLGYRNTPAGPRMLRPWMVCLAGSWPPLADGRGCPAATRTREFIGPTGPDGPVAAAGPRRRGCVMRPVQASLALVSPARNRSATISPPKRY